MNTSKILKESTYVTIDITNFNFSRHIGHDTLPKNDALRQLDIGDLSRPRFEGFPFCKVNATPLIDYRPRCSRCHAVLHSVNNDPYT